jgi:hypothetical protein
LPQGIPFLLPDENQPSSTEPLDDPRKNLTTWNGIDTSGPEFEKPTLTGLLDLANYGNGKATSASIDAFFEVSD